MEAKLGPIQHTEATCTPLGVFVVARTPASLVLLDVGAGVGGEMVWSGSGAERFLWDVPGVCCWCCVCVLCVCVF